MLVGGKRPSQCSDTSRLLTISVGPFSCGLHARFDEDNDNTTPCARLVNTQVEVRAKSTVFAAVESTGLISARMNPQR